MRPRLDGEGKPKLTLTACAVLPPGAISLQVAIPDGLFNAAYQKPAYADSVLSNAISCGSASGDCLPALATDGYSGNHHRWISSPDRPDHWIGVDLQDDFWVTTVNVFAGRDTTGNDAFEPDHPVCSYTFE